MSISSVDFEPHFQIKQELKMRNCENLEKIFLQFYEVLFQVDRYLYHSNPESYHKLHFDAVFAGFIFDEFTKSCEARIRPYFSQKIEVNSLPNSFEDVPAKVLRKHCKNFIQKTVRSIANEYGITTLSDKFKFTPEEIKKYQIQNPKQIARGFDCVCYALHLLGEPYFENDLYHIFSKPGRFLNILHILEKLNYDYVMDTPQKGDIIFYLNAAGKPKHMGIFLNSTTVISKWGGFPQIFIHDVYGTFYTSENFQGYLVLRKKDG